MWGRVLAGGLLGAVGCRYPTAYRCTEASQCVNGGVAGRCEPDGNCSYPDTTCPSGHRYGDLAAGGLADECTADDDPGESSDTPTASVTSAGVGTSDSTSTDEGTTTPCEPQAYYRDGDMDGYGDPEAAEQACEQPPGYVEDDTDCDDMDPRVHPDGLGCGEVPGLVAWYRLDEAAGADTVLDAVGSLHGDVNSAATLGVSGRFGGALRVDGTAYGAEIPGLAQAMSTETAYFSQGTLEAWARVDEIPMASEGMIVWLGEAGSEGYNVADVQLHAFDTGGGLRVGAHVPDAQGSRFHCSPATPASEPVPYETWFHVAVTWDGRECAFYVGGSLIDTDTMPNGLGGPGEYARFGGPHNDSARVIEGHIDEVMVWSVARTLAQIVADCGDCQ